MPKTTKSDVQDKRTAALQATLELISEQGFHATPMSQIAQRANIGVGTIYRYFENKEELLNALYLEVKSQMFGRVFQEGFKTTSIQESVKGLFRNIIHYMIEHPNALQFMEQYENSPLITPATREQVGQLVAPLFSVFQSAKTEGSIKDLPWEVLGGLAFGAAVSLVKLNLAEGVKVDNQVLEGSLEAIWDMLKR